MIHKNIYEDGEYNDTLESRVMFRINILISLTQLE